MTTKLVLLHWKDAVTPTQGWTDINELETELAECVSVGFVVEENNDPTLSTSEVADQMQAPSDGVISDEELASSYRSQADALFKEAKALREQAEELVPTKRKTSKKTAESV